jgi:nitroreductase
VRWYSSLGDAPVLVVVTAPDSDNELTLLNRLLSVGAAIENLLLAACEESLGACPFTFSYWVRDEISELLGVPQGESVVSIVAIGWPAAGLPAAPSKRADVAVWLD